MQMAVLLTLKIGKPVAGHITGVGAFWLCDIDFMPTGNRKNTSQIRVHLKQVILFI
jgi:hypothetical protein